MTTPTTCDSHKSLENGDITTMQQLKKPKTPFQYFQKSFVPKLKQEKTLNGDSIEVGSIMKETSRRWNELSDKEKEEYIQQSKQDKERYEKECMQRDQLVEADRKRKREEFSHAQTIVGKRERKRNPIVDSEAVQQTTFTETPKVRTSHEPSAAQIVRQQRKAEESSQKEALIQKRAGTASARLQYLLSQSDLFGYFNKKGKGFKTVKKSEKLSEKEEDESLLQDKPPCIVRITNQPSFIQYGTMRQYQLEGLNWMVNLAHQGINGILADEMGLGKTLQTISVLTYFYEFEQIKGPHIIFVPKSTLCNWLNEFKRWSPALRVIKLHGNKTERKDIIQMELRPGCPESERLFDVCVTTFEMCMKEKTALCKFAWRYLIIDEAHRIKNEASQFAQVVRMLETEHRLLLTGTPLQNNLHELWALLNFLLPDVFASSDEFDEWFNLDVDDDEAKKQMIGQLHKILRPFMLRRLKADVEKSLPPKKETLLFVGMSNMQKTLYKSLLLRDMDTIMGGPGSGVSRSALQNIVMQLRKCCGHPYLFENQEDRSLDPLGEHVVENCGKMVLLDKLLKKLKQRGSRVLLFTQMTRILDIFEDFCRMRQYEYCRIDGQTSYEDRESSIEQYNQENSSKFLFLLSTRAGGLGINLYTADIVILYDSDWNPQADLQAQDRAHRIGQKKEVNVYRFVTSDSVEEKIIERAQQKLKLDAMVVQQGRLQEKQSKLSKSDMLEMIRFGADQVFRATDSNITDEDIDAILAKGEQRTEEMKQKLQTHDKGDLLDFKLDGGRGMQSHDGVDYSKEKERQEELKRLAEAELARTMAQSMGKRERRAVLRPLQSMNNSGNNRQNDAKAKLLPKALRLPRMDDWQFYDKKRLLELHEAEVSNYEDAKAKSNGEKPPLPPHVVYLPDHEQEEKECLLKKAFSDWNKPQFFQFVRLLSRYGRNHIASVARDMNKPLEQVQRYVKVFYARGPKELSDWPRIQKSIEKGESKLLEMERLYEATVRKLSRYENPIDDMHMNYQGKIAKVYTEEEDRALLCAVHRFGYGEWENIRQYVASMDRFAFDYYLRSRSSVEIMRRCDSLMRNCEKENAEMEARERKESALRAQLEKQRHDVSRQLQKARQELRQRQKRVDELVTREVKRMKAQRSAKRLKKRKERDEEKDCVLARVPELAAYLSETKEMDAVQVAIDFTQKIKKESGQQVQAAHVLKYIREFAVPVEDPNASGAWVLDSEMLEKLQSFAEKAEVTNDPKTEKSKDVQRQCTNTSRSAILFNEFNVRVPRSAYVLFAIENLEHVKAQMIQERGAENASPYTPSPLEVLHKVQKLWSGLSKEESAFYKECEARDRVRYETEMRKVTKA